MKVEEKIDQNLFYVSDTLSDMSESTVPQGGLDYLPLPTEIFLMDIFVYLSLHDITKIRRVRWLQPEWK